MRLDLPPTKTNQVADGCEKGVARIPARTYVYMYVYVYVYVCACMYAYVRVHVFAYA